MKIAILFDTVTGNTEKMAGVIAQGANSIEGIEAKIFSIDDFDGDFVAESKCVILGTPTYKTSCSAKTKVWLDELVSGDLKMGGKIAGAFATANYVHGGGDMAVRTILDHFMCFGMMAYSGGGSQGRPVIHLGPVALGEHLEDFTEIFTVYGQRMAKKTVEVFGEK